MHHMNTRVLQWVWWGVRWTDAPKVREHLLEGGWPRQAEDTGEALKHLLMRREDLELNDEGCDHALSHCLGRLSVRAAGGWILAACELAPPPAARNERRDEENAHDHQGHKVGGAIGAQAVAWLASARARGAEALLANPAQRADVADGAVARCVDTAEAARTMEARLDLDRARIGAPTPCGEVERRGHRLASAACADRARLARRVQRVLVLPRGAAALLLARGANRPHRVLLRARLARRLLAIGFGLEGAARTRAAHDAALCIAALVRASRADASEAIGDACAAFKGDGVVGRRHKAVGARTLREVGGGGGARSVQRAGLATACAVDVEVGVEGARIALIDVAGAAPVAARTDGLTNDAQRRLRGRLHHNAHVLAKGGAH